MTVRHQWGFKPLTNSTAPGFMTGTVDNTSTSFVLQSSALNRVWQGPFNRQVRVSEKSGADYYIAFGTSTIVVGTTNGVQCLGGTVEQFGVDPSQTYMAVVSTTDVNINVVLGYGGG